MATAERNRIHPTEKPVELERWLIETYSNPGDTVLDPCFGSCSAGVASIMTGRKFIGIESDPDIFQKGKERIDKACSDF